MNKFLQVSAEREISRVRGSLLKKLCEEEGCTIEEVIESCTIDSINPGMCSHCGAYVSSVEPDCYDGYCEACGRNTVESALVLAGIL